MKSVGEAMAIGRTFRGAAKGAAQHGDRAFGARSGRAPGDGGADAFRAELSAPRPDRLLMAAEALRAGLTVEEIQTATRFDPWFLRELLRIVAAEEEVAASGLPQDAAGLQAAQGARLLRPQARRAGRVREAKVRTLRDRLGVTPPTSGSTPAPASSPPTRPTCIRPTMAASPSLNARPIPRRGKK